MSFIFYFSNSSSLNENLLRSDEQTLSQKKVIYWDTIFLFLIFLSTD